LVFAGALRFKIGGKARKSARLYTSVHGVQQVLIGAELARSQAITGSAA